MASSSFELDDQTDEDFFDKLVNDDLDFAGSSKPSGVVESSEVELANAIENLSISAVEKPEKADSVSEDSFGFGDGLGEKTNVDLANTLVAAEESKVSELESESGKVKVIQWDSFNSNSPNHRGSYSDLFGGLEDNSDDPFANVGVGENSDFQASVKNVALEESFVGGLSSSYEQPLEAQQNYGNSEDLNSSQYWENAYPGWKYDSGTGQWYQVEGYDANANANANANVNVNVNANSNGDLNHYSHLQESSNLINSNALVQKSDYSYSEQTATNTVVSENASDWNQVSQGSTEYPAHMVFDPQYPGWYYDTISQEWKSLDSYIPATDHSKSAAGNQQYVNNNDQYYASQNIATQQDDAAKWDGSLSVYNQQNASVWQSQQAAQNVAGHGGTQQLGSQYLANDQVNNSLSHQHMGFSQGFDGGFGVSSGIQNVNTPVNFGQFQNQVQEVKSQEVHFSAAQFNSRNMAQFSTQPLQNQEVKSQESHFSAAQFNSHNMAQFPTQPLQNQSSSAFSFAGTEERTSEKRPPHALVTFGFGGKLVVMKDATSSYSSSAYGSQDAQGAGGVINVYNLMDVVTDTNGTSGLETGGRDYFNALCHQSYPGPLVGGNPGSKELNKWIDDRIASYETSYMDLGTRDLLRMLFSLLKIAVQYYGKLRSPFGSDQALKENDSPDSAVAKLFAAAKKVQEFGNVTQCLQNIPSEAQIQATALEVQKLLVSGRKKEALEFAQEGQLWGPALVLASQLGDQPYGETVKKMALTQFLPGSPLRTLCLLIAGQPADVFSNAISQSTVPDSFTMFQQPTQVQQNSTLDEWTQNLAIIAANRTKDDELVIIHLGDSLWKETREIIAAHICYLVAEANLEQYSSSARLCLIGADHWKSPRTYASPEAIQRTELYEYSKVLGNSQFLLLPFQPYKLVYAYMLAEVGKTSVALKYCQAILKSLKTGRAPELEAWKQLVLSLEERIKTHQQGGYGTNLASTKLVGKILTFFDSTAHRVVGTLPPPIPLTAQGNAQHNEHSQQFGIPRISNSHSTLSSPFLMPSASMEGISASGNDNITMPNRSVSEPDFSRSPRKDSSKKENSNAQEKTTGPGSSRFGRFRSQIFQKTVGLVIRPRSDKQAKLGEANTFYYDENLKRWVEKGAELPPEQEALAPPPTAAAFQQSRTQDYNSIQSSPQPDRFNTAQEPRSSSPPESSPGFPPVPPGANQFSARGRMGVRSRYVDTFNKSGPVTTPNLFHSPPTQAAKPIGGGFNPKFFVPAPVTSSDQTPQSEGFQEGTITGNDSSGSLKDFNDAASPSLVTTQMPATVPTMQRFPSMDTIVSKSGDMGRGYNNSSVPPNSRRTASWSGGLNDAQHPSFSSSSATMTKNEVRPLGEALGIPPQMYMASNNPVQHMRRNSGSFGDDLHEVQL